MDRWSFKKLLKKADLPNIQFHALRHSAASYFLKNIHPKVVQKILGDATIQVVLDIYSHVIQPLKFDAVDLWDDFLEEGDKETTKNQQEKKEGDGEKKIDKRD